LGQGDPRTRRADAGVEGLLLPQGLRLHAGLHRIPARQLPRAGPPLLRRPEPRVAAGRVEGAARGLRRALLRPDLERRKRRRRPAVTVAPSSGRRWTWGKTSSKLRWEAEMPKPMDLPASLMGGPPQPAAPPGPPGGRG